MKNQKSNKVIENIKEFVKKNQKLVIIVGAILLVLIIVLILFALMPKAGDNKDTATNTKSKIVANTSADIIKEEEYKGLKFDNATLLKENGIYTLSMTVTNTTNETVDIEQVDIPIKDKNGNTIITLLGYIGKDFKPNETRTITASTSADLSKAKAKTIADYTPIQNKEN